MVYFQYNQRNIRFADGAVLTSSKRNVYQRNQLYLLYSGASLSRQRQWLHHDAVRTNDGRVIRCVSLRPHVGRQIKT